MQDKNTGIDLKPVAVGCMWDLFDCASEHDNELLFPYNADFSNSCETITDWRILLRGVDQWVNWLYGYAEDLI
jgi:hypothetical protein